jgi:hypothetical protein
VIHEKTTHSYILMSTGFLSQNWKFVETDKGARMEQAALRAMGEEQFTWAHLLYGKLATVRVGLFYFPSRFDTDTDRAVIEALRAFGQNTGADTSVNIWDPTDPAFEHALELFGLKAVPAVVLVTGLQVPGLQPRGPTETPLYSIIVDQPGVLSDAGPFQSVINSAHEVLVRANPKEIAAYIRAQKAGSILSAIGKIASHLREEILKWKLKLGLPGGVSVQIG